MPDLPIAESWFHAEKVFDGVTQISEPHFDPLLNANMHLIEGQDRDVIFDTGNGVLPLKPFLQTLRANPDKPILCISSHTHIDHIGGIGEFEERYVHPKEAQEHISPDPGSLYSADFDAGLQVIFERAGYAPLPELTILALPFAGYDPKTYALQGAAITGYAAEGDRFDLGGGQVLEVIDLPGHSVGGIGLLDRARKILFSGDVIYDGPLIYDAPGMSLTEYEHSFQKLERLDVEWIFAGHDAPFGKARMLEIIAYYRGLWRDSNDSAKN